MPLGRRSLPAGGALDFAKARREAARDYDMPTARKSEYIEGTDSQVVVSGGQREGVITLRGRTRTGAKITSSVAAYLNLKCKGIKDKAKVKACQNEATGRWDPKKKLTRAQLITALKKLTITEDQEKMLSDDLRKELA